MDDNDIVIVTYDCLCSLGTDLETTWPKLVGNQSGVVHIDHYDPSQESLRGIDMIAYGGQIPISFDKLAGSDAKYKSWPDPSYHAVKSLTERVLDKINFDVSDHDPQRIGFLGGTAMSSESARDRVGRTYRAYSKFILTQCHNIPVSAAASSFGIQGPCFSIGGACASSAHAIFVAYQFLKADLIDLALVAGFEFPIVPFCVGGLEWISALYRRDKEKDRAYHDPTKASRPFSIDRRGFVLSEGAGIVLISKSSYAKKKNWPVKGIIKGGYANCDANHLTRISVENINRCMKSAMDASEIDKTQIDCISAHATSTPIGDGVEMNAFSDVFQDRLRRIPITASKSQIGHCLGAASILAFIFAVEGMNRGVVLPVLNHIQDSSLPQALVPTETLDYRCSIILLNSFGFGGTNVSLVVQL